MARDGCARGVKCKINGLTAGLVLKGTLMALWKDGLTVLEQFSRTMRKGSPALT